jgi:hypothetical protein
MTLPWSWLALVVTVVVSLARKDTSDQLAPRFFLRLLLLLLLHWLRLLVVE